MPTVATSLFLTQCSQYGFTLLLLTANILIWFGWREDMAGIVTRVQCSQAGDPEGSDLVDHTLEGTPLQELFGFFGFPFFSPPSTMIF